MYWHLTIVPAKRAIGVMYLVLQPAQGVGTTPATTTPATTTPSTQPPASTDGETSSFMDKLKGFVDEVGLPIILAVVFILIIIIVLIFALALRPKRPYGAPDITQSPRGGFMPQGITCPVCGFANTPEKKFCGNCGSGLASAQTSYSQRMPPAPPVPPAQTASAACTACGNANPPGSQFCGNCGTSLMTKQQGGSWQARQPGAPPDSCPACGAPMQPGRQFCGNCGSPLRSANEQQVVGSYQTFACPICGATINQGQNPCPGCNTWLDWG